MVEVTREDFRDTPNNGNGTAAGAERAKQQSTHIGWIDSRRRFLIDQNKDNVIFENGTMRLKGNEDIRAGRYVRLKHGTINSFYYCESVCHEFVPFVGYTTNVNFERGTGFIDRARREAGIESPYYSELADGHK